MACGCAFGAAGAVLAFSPESAATHKAGKAVEPTAQRPDIVAKFTSGSISFDANGNVGTTTLKGATISLSTDDPYCVPTPAKPCRYTLNQLDLVANDTSVKDVAVRGLHAFNWYPAMGLVDDGSGTKLSLPPGMAFNFSGTVGSSPVAFTVRPSEPGVLALVIDPVLQKITLMGSLSGSRDGWNIKLTIHATSDGNFVNLPPTANAGPDQTVSTDCFAMVSLDKSGTTDPNGNLAYSYFTESGYAIGEGNSPVAMFPGDHRVALDAFDSLGARGRDEVLLHVKDDGTTKPLAGATLYSIEVPNGTKVDDFAVVASDTLNFKPTTPLKGNAASFGIGGTTLAPKAVIDGDLWSFGPVQLSPSAQITGTVHTASTVDLKPNASVGNIDRLTSLSPTSAISWNVVFPTQAGAPVSVGPNGSTAIGPGNYGDIDLGPKAKISLTSGTYFASKFSVGPNAIVTVDDSAGPVLLYLRGGLDPMPLT